MHQVVREHLETFLGEARLRGGGEGLPRFVERELREFLTCGVLAEGFARFRCTDCQREILVAFSCKGYHLLLARDLGYIAADDSDKLRGDYSRVGQMLTRLAQALR